MSDKVSFDALEGATSLAQALKGDISVLLERLRSDAMLLEGERDFLADLIEGKRALPQSRPASLLVSLRDDDMVEEVLAARVLYPKARHLVAGVARRHGVTQSYLYRKLREVEGSRPASEKMKVRVDRWVAKVEAFEAGSKRVWRLEAHARSAARRHRAADQADVN